MALQANALVSAAEAKSFLNIQGTSSDALLDSVINAASDMIEKELNRPVKEASYTGVRLIGPKGPKLYLRASPINISQTFTVKMNETTQTVWKQESDGDPANFDVLVGTDAPEGPLGLRNHLYRASGWEASSNGHPYNVLVTYTGGYATVPTDLKDAALYVIQKLFRDRQKQLADVQTVTHPSGAITMFDLVLPRLALRLFNQYRWVPVG